LEKLDAMHVTGSSTGYFFLDVAGNLHAYIIPVFSIHWC